ncbi:MAG TPA: prenyltransferase/squalene oxidase repeat-containing protein [Pirellulales bacterium]|jgi:squalene-hopene/tetraprenyl-beta-curcumene cyclase|nr:prenyltransferase/squalene oxidase repeat-containing protein [Pirellulales bacterium]
MEPVATASPPLLRGPANVEFSDSGETSSLVARCQLASERTAAWLLQHQQADGHWVAELEGDTILESEFILLLAFLGRNDSQIAHKAARYLLSKQLPCGGWTTHPGGPVDVSASVKAYFALKLTGHDSGHAAMQRARSAVLAHGGADAVNSFTRFYLALLGQIGYEQCPAVPPEAILLPRWFPINLYRVSAWSRTIIVPLSIMWANRPTTAIDSRLGITELFIRQPKDWPPLRCPGQQGGTGFLSWDHFFRTVDRGLKFIERRKWLPLRARALAVAEHWMTARFEGSQGLGAIFPPMIWSVIALKCLGYADDSPEVRFCHEHLEGLIIEEGESARLQPCKSPVWDTAISLRALAAAQGGANAAARSRGVDWLLEREVRASGDWRETVRAPAGGWCFEYANDFYPDVDDTIMVLMALAEQFDGADSGEPETMATVRWSDQQAFGSRREAHRHLTHLDRAAAAGQRALHWVLALQNRDGGWGAFDRDNDHEFLCHVPFADHNAMIDPSTPDLTGRVLEMLGIYGFNPKNPVCQRAIHYMRRTQEADGSWFGRWGVNYVYGTWQALVGLASIGISPQDPMMRAGRDWLLGCQQSCGGWGESPDSYANPKLAGQGPVTASQTAWAILGLVAAEQAHSTAVQRGLAYLLETQQADGAWREDEFTGTGFPQVFYLRYHYYPIYFPLLAMAAWAAAMRGGGGDASARTTKRSPLAVQTARA